MCTDGEGGEGKGRTEQILGEELPALAKEVARVEAVRIYAGELLTMYRMEMPKIGLRCSVSVGVDCVITNIMVGITLVFHLRI